MINFKAQPIRLVRGFTLVEMLVYLAIFMVVSTASVTFLISLNDFIRQYKIETILYKSGTNAMEQIILGIRQADQVNMLNSTFNSPSTGRLTVEHGASSTAFLLNAGTLEISIDGTNLGDVLNDNVSVSEFTVYHYPLAVGELVRVKLRLDATVGTVTKSLTLYGGSVVRGSI